MNYMKIQKKTFEKGATLTGRNGKDERERTRRNLAGKVGPRPGVR